MDLTKVLITPLSQIHVEKGDVWHAIKKTDLGFLDFGEAYFSWIDGGAIKGWKRHNQMTMNLIVPVGLVRFVFYSEQTKEFRVEDVGTNRYSRISVPPGLWFGFKGLHNPQSLILNIASVLHDPCEVDRLELKKIQYEWG